MVSVADAVRFLGWLAIVGVLFGCATGVSERAETVSSTGVVKSATTAPRELPPDPMAKGSASAPVALVVFSDYECSYCYRLHHEVLSTLRKEYVDTGKVRLIHKDLPLPMHKQALPAAVAARCAAAQDRFWEMDDLLFTNQSKLGPETYARIAQHIGLDLKSFHGCQQDPDVKRVVMHDSREAMGLGIKGTPTLVLGRYDGERMQTHGIAKGFVNYAALKAEIDKLLTIR